MAEAAFTMDELPDPFCISLGSSNCLNLIKFLNTILLVDVPNADLYLFLAISVLALLAVAQQFDVFTRPPPVPTKELPRRPALQVIFKPDDVIGTATAAVASSVANEQKEAHSIADEISIFTEDEGSSLWTTEKKEASTQRSGFTTGSKLPSQKKIYKKAQQPRKTNVQHHGLPDSFAPLLSSSEMEVLWDGLTADLIHAIQVQAQVRLREGRHTIPLDKDNMRPQFWFDSSGSDIFSAQNETPKKGCKISANFFVGSERMTLDEDLDTSKHISERSQPMVKSGDLIFDPPLRLGNVAPTLLHFPQLFEDKAMPRLRRMQFVGFVIEFLASLWFLLEKILWMIERRCQVHLSKVKLAPIYRGESAVGEAQWRLSLSFTGHLLLFDFLPIPFISFHLPTFVIPQPHALLEYLLTAQPLASAKLHRENIAEERITVAALSALDSFSTSVKAVVTPPAVEMDLTMPGGLTLSFEMMHGLDVTNNNRMKRESTPPTLLNIPKQSSNNTLNSWFNGGQSNTDSSRLKHQHISVPSSAHLPSQLFDANSMSPWFFETAVDGSITTEKIVVNVSRCMGRQQDESSSFPSRSTFSVTGSVVVCRAQSDIAALNRRPTSGAPLLKRNLSGTLAKNTSNSLPPIHALLMFPDTYVPSSKRSSGHLVEYDYAFDVGEETQLDTVSLSYGASHPMLKGGTIVSCMLESIYAYGSIHAREGAVVDPSEKLRKRNILRHLPAVDFTAGVQNMFIPKSSVSYLDDGNTRSIPEMDGGRLMIRVLGGLDESMLNNNVSSSQIVKEGIKVVADFGVTTFASKNESNLNEFPELDIFDKLCSYILGTCDGSITCHLRPQRLLSSTSSSGPNFYNPLEAYEIDFSGSKVSLRLKEANFNLGHRRVIVPTETTFAVKVLESVVNMGFEGTTKCELAWDFQGTSPILQVTAPGHTIAQTSHEDRKQAPLLIKALCQGRLNLDVSSVGGISFTQASTSRENKEGLYDWKFFNALVSPDDDSPARMMDVLHDKKTMNRLLAVTKLINADLEKIASYLLTKVWRAKEIFDQEGVSDPGHAIPGHRMARLMSLFLCGDVSQVDEILPVIQRVVAGNGVDVVKVKELIRKHVSKYDDWAAEIDRAVKWAAMMLGPMTVPSPFVETEVPPLTECLDSKRYANAGIPTAKSLYDTLHDKPKLPLDPTFSNLVSRIAPYMTFRQVSYVLNSRPASHWQPFDLKRLRYVYATKKKVDEISESYGGLSFMPQSFFVSVFLGEATRSSLRAATASNDNTNNPETEVKVGYRSALDMLRRQRSPKFDSEGFIMSPAGRVASMNDFGNYRSNQNLLDSASDVSDDLLGDSLLGPQDIAVLLQAGLTSAIKGSTVVQLNQRMLLDLMASQPASFAIGVLAELGADGPRQLANALMALCDLDQGSFKEAHCIDIHALLEMWLPGLKIPRRDDYLAGGRWARQSFYDAIYGVAISILDLSETYIGLKLRIQQVRHHNERDPLPVPMELVSDLNDQPTSQLMSTIKEAVTKISVADDLAQTAFDDLRSSGRSTKDSDLCTSACQAYKEAFAACAQVISIDKLAFQSDWLKAFFRRNYDALMVKSIYDNIVDDVDEVRVWMEALRRGSMGNTQSQPDPFFICPEEQKEQDLIDGIIDALFFDKKELEYIKNDPLVRMLIGNDPGHYNFTIITAMGVITEGKQGTELHTAIERLEKERGVATIRADTGTARSIDYNANKIEEAVNIAVELKRPYGLVGYSQGCANEMNFEAMMISGTPDQQKVITGDYGLVCRQLLFSAANGSMHGPATEAKVHQLITMIEEFLKYQQGYFSRAFISSTIDVMNSGLDSSAFQKFLGGTKSFLPYASRTFWREAQHLPHIPTCVIRGVLEAHTTPESLDMLSNTLTKQSGSALHDSQVHVYDAVGHPVYFKNRNGRILKSTDMGGAVQRTHHWSPLCEEVEYVRTDRDVEHGVFDCAKDRHIFPFCDVNARFGIIKYADVEN
eukprot:scaffold6437_cov98-Skeletonema_dohrnii-CCMP3373.AAC.3